MSTELAQGTKALSHIKKAVDLALSAVKPTFGPNASTTLMFRTYNRGPRFVDDGFWTLESIVPKNPFVKLAFEAFKEATMQTNRKVGDGTSQTTILAANLFNEIYEKIYAEREGYSATGTAKKNYRKDILNSATEIKELVRKAAKKVETLEELEQISAISLGEESELSKTIAKMAWEVGVDGFIDVVEGYKGEVETELIKGARFYAKTCGKAFINKPERFEMVIEDAPVLITNHKIDDNQIVKYLVENVLQTNKAIIIAPDFSNSVLVPMALSQKNGTFISPVKVPSLRTEQLEDLAIFCGATLIDKDKGMKLENASKLFCGSVEKLVVKDVETREDAIIIGGKGEKEGAVKERIATLRGQLAETKEHQFKLLMERRIASMASAGGVIRVGAPSEAESLPLKLKVEDDVYACRSAIKSGFVKGGGLCLKEIAETLPDGHILKTTLLAPYKQIQDNTGGIEIGDEIIDPADAIYYAVEHATSVVSSLITVKTLVAEPTEITEGEALTKVAKAIHFGTLVTLKEKGIMNENERLIFEDARMGMSEDEYTLTHQD